MYYFALLTVLSCILLVQADDVTQWKDFIQKCGGVMHPKGLSCCIKKYMSADVMEEIKECMQLPDKPPSCEREICIAKKKGFASDDGTIDKDKLKSALSNLNDKDLETSIVEDCVDGDLSEYGPADFCDLKKLDICVRLHLIVDCPEWSSEGSCSGFSEAATACIKLLT